MEIAVVIPENQLDRWDNFVRRHPYGWLCHLTAWEKVLKRATNLKSCYYLAIIDQTTGEIRASMQVYLVRSMIIKSRLISAPLTTIFDPLVSSEDQLNVLMAKAIELLGKTQSDLLKIKTLHSASYFDQTKLSKDNRFRYHYLSLQDNLDNIWKNLHRSCVRQHISRASRQGLTVGLAESKTDLKKFYSLYQRIRKNHGLPSIPYVYFESIWDVFYPNHNVYFFIAEFESRPAAALMAFKFKNHMSAEALGWEPAFKWLTPSIFIFWEAIKFAKASGCTSFDFGRTSIENQELIVFKRRWGTKEIEMPVFSYPPDKGHKLESKVPRCLEKTANLIFFNSPPMLYVLLSRVFYSLFLE